MNMEGWILYLILSSTLLLTLVHSCSEELSLTEDSLHIHSPGYDKGRNYDINLHCLWNIKSSSKVFVNFTAFNVEYHFKCDWDFVKVYDGQCGAAKATKFCGHTAPSSFIHNGNICIEFVSDYVVTKPGFEVFIKAEKESTELQTALRTTSAYSMSTTATKTYTTNKPETISDKAFAGGMTLINPTSVDDVVTSTMTSDNATPSNSVISSGITSINSITADTTITTMTVSSEPAITTSIDSTIMTPVNPALDDNLGTKLTALINRSPTENVIISSTIYNHPISVDHKSIIVAPTSIDHLPTESVDSQLSSTIEIHRTSLNTYSVINKQAKSIYPTTADSVALSSITTSMQPSSANSERANSINPSQTESAIITSMSIKGHPTPVKSSNTFTTTPTKNKNTVTNSIINEGITSVNSISFNDSRITSQDYTLDDDNSVITRQTSDHPTRIDSLVTTKMTTYDAKSFISINTTATSVYYEATQFTTSTQAHEETLKTLPKSKSSSEIVKVDLLSSSQNNLLSSLTNIQPSSTTGSSQWNIEQPSSTTYSSQWNIEQPSSTTDSSQWNIEQPSSTTDSSQWNIEQPSSTTDSSQWNIEQPSSTTDSSQWNIEQPSSTTDSSQWNIEQPSSTADSSQWNIEQPSSTTDSSQWNIQPSSTTDSSQWNIEQPSSTTDSSQWNIEQPSSTTDSSQWNIEQPSSTTDSSQWNIDYFDVKTEYFSADVMPSTIIFSSRQISASYECDKTKETAYSDVYSTGNTQDDFNSYNIQHSSAGTLFTNEIEYSSVTSDLEDYTAFDFSSLTVIDASQVPTNEVHHGNIMSANFLDTSFVSAAANSNQKETDIHTESINSNAYKDNGSCDFYTPMNTLRHQSSINNVKDILITSVPTFDILQLTSALPLKSNQIRSNTPSLYDNLPIHTLIDTSMAFSTTLVQPHSSSVITTLIEDTNVSPVVLPVACHITEQVLLDDLGKITMNIPFQGDKVACTWLLLAKRNRAIHLNITYKNANPSTECEQNRIVLYDGVFKQPGHLGQLCKNSTQHVISTESTLLLELFSTRGPVSIKVIYNATEIDQSCADNYSLCDGSNCLPSEWWCDNEIDCSNGYDEQMCGLCSLDEYRCGNGRCIKNLLKCNGRYDCIDASDETECATLNNQILRVRYGSIWLPVCGDNWNDSLGNSICKYMSYDSSSNSHIKASNHNVSVSIQYDPASTGMFNYWTPITSCQTEVHLSCSKEECGKRSSSLMVPYIIGGSQSYRGQWPWVVAIRVGGNFVCGGTLISAIWVVTAGHCLQNVISLPHMISVVLGTTFKDGRDGRVLNVVEIIIHPDFDSIYNADIALLRLKKPDVFNDFTQKTCLPHPGYILPRNLVCYIAGWGSTNPSDKSVQNFPDALHHAKVNIWSNTKCNNVYSSEIKDNMICAGLLEGGVDTCQGDSGGPLMCSKDHETWQLVGITSWGNSVCGAPKSPGVYTRITSYSSWIWSALENEGKLEFGKCDFEGPGICEFQDLSDGLFSWTKRKGGWTLGGQPLTDNTLQSNEGHYMYADTYLVSGTESSHAVLQLKLNETLKEKCLSFAYHFYGNHRLTLKVKVVTKDNVTAELWTLSIISATWDTTEIKIPNGTTDLNIITIRNSHSGNGGVAVDDLFLSDDRCMDIIALSCNFNSGHTCGYSNYTGETDYWMLDRPSSMTGTDWFLKYSGNSRSSGGKARLLSPVMQSRGPRCFTFRYKLCMPYANSLSVLLGFVFNDVKYFGSSLWARSTSDENCSAWTKGSVNIPSMPLEHFIAVQVEQKFLSNDVYLDNLDFYNGNCIT